MKVVKLTKKMLRMHPADLLVELGAVNAEVSRTFPQHVYISKEDYRLLKKNLIKEFAEKRKYKSKLVNYSVNVDLFNFGPNQNLENAIRPGYILVDEEGIRIEIVKAKLNG